MEEDAFLANAATPDGFSATGGRERHISRTWTVRFYIEPVRRSREYQHGCAGKTLRGAFTTMRSVHPSTELEYGTPRGHVQSYTELDPS